MKIYFYISFIFVIVITFPGCETSNPQVTLSNPGREMKSIPPELRHSNRPAEKVAFVGMRNKSIYAADHLWDVASHLLTTRLIEIGYLSVVDWDRMKRDFDPIQLKNASLVSSPEQFLDVKRRLNCDLFLGGAITYYDVSQAGKVSAISKNKTLTTTIRVDLWLQDAETGEFVSAATGSGRATQQFTGGLLGGNIGTWDMNIANQALDIAIDDSLIKLLTLYDQRKGRFRQSAEFAISEIPEPQPSTATIASTSSRPAQTVPSPISSTPPAPPPRRTRPNRSVSPGAPSNFQRTSNKWALIIGVGQFMDTRINPLDYTAKDAQAMYRYLTDPGGGNFPSEQAFLLTNQSATTFNLKYTLDIISKHSRPGDIVVIFISSHGTPGEMDVEEVGYLATYDTMVDSLYATAFNMSELVSAVNNRIQAKTVITLADACYSAGSFKNVQFLKLKGAKDLIVETGPTGFSSPNSSGAFRARNFGISESTAQKLSSGSGRIFIASSRVDERSWESDRLQHGFFTYYLLDAFSRQEIGGSIQKAFDYIQKVIPQEVMREKGHAQNPVMGLNEVEGTIRLNFPPVSVSSNLPSQQAN
jgi:uncharacterized caspase-like protein/curli biogenesis system outer membrane secretion channel CsgG